MVSQAAVTGASALSQWMALSIYLSLRVVYSASAAKRAQTSFIRTLYAAPAAQHGFVGAARTCSCARRCVRTTRRTVAFCSAAAPRDSCTVRAQTNPQTNKTCTINYTLTKHKFTPLLLMRWHSDAVDINTLTASGFLFGSSAWIAVKAFNLGFSFNLSANIIYKPTFTLTTVTGSKKKKHTTL